MAVALDIEIQAGLSMLGSEEKQTLLSVTKSFLSLKQSAGAARVSKEQYNRAQDEAVAWVKEGQYYSQEDAEAEAF